MPSSFVRHRGEGCAATTKATDVFTCPSRWSYHRRELVGVPSSAEAYHESLNRSGPASSKFAQLCQITRDTGELG